MIFKLAIGQTLYAMDQMRNSLPQLNSGYIEYYVDNQQWDRIRTLIKRIQHHSQCPDRKFAILDWIDNGMPDNCRPLESLT